MQEPVYTTTGPIDHSTGRALLYPRVSTVAQANAGYSLDDQEKRQRAYCAERGYVVVGVYREAYSGDTGHRPALDAIIGRLVAGEASRVIAADLDRFTRLPVAESFLLRGMIRQAGGELEFVEGGAIYEDAETGDIQYALKAWMANMEKINILKRTTRGRAQKLASGKVVGMGRAPYGLRYMTDAKDLTAAGKERRVGYVEHTAEAVIVRRIFAEYVGGASLYEIAAGLARDSIPSPMGQPTWSRGTIQKLLGHPVYTGVVHANRWMTHKIDTKSGRSYRRRPLDEQTLLHDRAPQIVDATSWATVQARLAENRTNRRRPPADRDAHLLRGGHVRCALCGTIMGNAMHIGQSGRPGYRCGRMGEHRCSNTNSIMADTLDREVWARVAAAMADPERVAAAVAQARETANPLTEVRTRALADRRQVVAQQVENLTVNLGLVSGPAAAVVAKRLEATVDELTTLDAEAETLAREAADWQAAQSQLTDLMAALRRVETQLGTATTERKRWALAMLNVTVLVGPKSSVPRWTATALIDLPESTTSGLLSPVSWNTRQQDTRRIAVPLELAAD